MVSLSRVARLVAPFTFAAAFAAAALFSSSAARADGAKRGGETAALLAAESKPMEAPKPVAQRPTANAKHHARHAKAKHHAAKGHHGGHVKPAKAKPAKPATKAGAKHGSKVRA